MNPKIREALEAIGDKMERIRSACAGSEPLIDIQLTAEDALDEVGEALDALDDDWIPVSERLPPNHVAIEMRLKIPGRFYEKTRELSFFIERENIKIRINHDDEWRSLPPPEDKGDD